MVLLVLSGGCQIWQYEIAQNEALAHVGTLPYCGGSLYKPLL